MSSRDRERSISALALGALVLWAACQSQNLATPVNLHPTRGPANGDASVARDGGRAVGDASFGSGDAVSLGFCSFTVPSCPPTVPTQGTPCGQATSTPCEYGDDSRSACNTLATCTPSGWNLQPPATDLTSPCPTPQPACPPSFPSPSDASASCPADQQYQCVYPEGICLCSGGQLSCSALPNSCPATRPRAGTPCGTDSGACSLWGYSCTLDSVQCACGVWIPSICLLQI